MLDKFKQFAQLKAIQDEVRKEIFTAERSGVKVAVRGDLSVESIEIDDQAEPGLIADIIKDLINEAMRSAQQAAAQKMMNMGFGG